MLFSVKCIPILQLVLVGMAYASAVTLSFTQQEDQVLPGSGILDTTPTLNIDEDSHGVSFDQYRITNVRVSITLENQGGTQNSPASLSVGKERTVYEDSGLIILCSTLEGATPCQRGTTMLFSDSGNDGGFRPPFDSLVSEFGGKDLAGGYVLVVVGGAPGRILEWTLEFEVETPTYSCGGHTVNTCSQCPFGPDGTNHHQYWCHGECVWEDGSCRKKKLADVDCGYYGDRPGFFRPSCSDCVNSASTNAFSCSGDCEERSGRCVAKDDDRRQLLRGGGTA